MTQAAPKPDNEVERLEALYAYDILDTPPEGGYDDLTEIAAQIFGVPISLISLVDDGRQWFKSRRGLEAMETSRDVAFCAYAIRDTSAPLVVPNALNDRRFAENPLVLESPNIRFYAGAPLVTPRGYAIGTLCVIAPHALDPTEAQLSALSALARQVVAQLELRRSALRYRAAEERARQAVEAERELMATVSHELRTPTNAVIGFAELLEQTPLTPEQLDYSKLIVQSGELLLNLIGDILDVARLEAGKLRIHATALGLPDIVHHVIRLLNHLAIEKGVALCAQLPEEPLPLACGDRTRVTQVLVNLVGNALKFIEQGSVSIRLVHLGDRLRCEVRDTGPGLSVEQQSRLFQRFEQADATIAVKYGGTGLGLAISHRLIENMGGQIGCASELGQGATFWFELPTATADLVGRAEAAGVRQLEQPQTEPLNARVLVCEDNVVNQKLAMRLLTRLGCVVDIAADGEQGVEQVTKAAYDIILMDHKMPAMDGLEATRRIRALLPNLRLPIIALTASASAEERARCLEAGMDDHVSKPMRADQLARTMRRWLGQRQAA